MPLNYNIQNTEKKDIPRLLELGRSRLKRKLQHNVFAQKAIDEKHAKFQKKEKLFTAKYRRVEVQLREFLERKTGSKNGMYVGYANFRQQGIYKVNTEQALHNRFVHRLQINTRDYYNAIVLDIDVLFKNCVPSEEPCDFNVYTQEHWSNLGLPEPSFIVRDTMLDPREYDFNWDWWCKQIAKRGKCHCIYLLKKPVYRNREDKTAEIYYDAVKRLLIEKFAADTGYVGMIIKNPFNIIDYETIFNSSEELKLFELKELADAIQLPKRTNKDKAKIKARYEGRNVSIFDAVREEFYEKLNKFSKSIELENSILERCIELSYYVTNEYGEPLPFSEIKSIAKSIAKYCWKMKSGRIPDFLDYRSEKGRLKADKRRENSIKNRCKKSEEKYNILKNTLESENMNEISINKLAEKHKVTRKKMVEILLDVNIKVRNREDYLNEAQEKRKRAFELRQQGMKYKDIAEEMEISLSHAKNLVVAYKRNNQTQGANND